MKRVFHPTLNSWQDVSDDQVDSWKDAGWRVTKPDHVDDSDALPVGAFHIATVDIAPTPPPGDADRVAAKRPAAKRPAAKGAAGSGNRSRSSGRKTSSAAPAPAGTSAAGPAAASPTTEK